jgi:hypothetical protein
MAYTDYLTRTTAETRRIFERGIRRGDVRSDLDISAAVTLVASSLLMRAVVEGRTPDEAFAESVLEFIAARAAA